MVRKSVHIIDDHAVVRSVLRGILERDGFEVTGDSPDLADGLRRCRLAQPDLVVLDSVLPGTSGLAALETLRAAIPDTPIVYLETTGDELYRSAALRAGAAACAFKEEVDTELLPAARAASSPARGSHSSAEAGGDRQTHRKPDMTRPLPAP